MQPQYRCQVKVTLLDLWCNTAVKDWTLQLHLQCCRHPPLESTTVRSLSLPDRADRDYGERNLSLVTRTQTQPTSDRQHFLRGTTNVREPVCLHRLIWWMKAISPSHIYCLSTALLQSHKGFRSTITRIGWGGQFTSADLCTPRVELNKQQLW